MFYTFHQLISNPIRLFQNKTTLIKTRSMKKQKRLMLAWTIATTFEIVCLTYLLQSYTTTPQDILLQGFEYF